MLLLEAEENPWLIMKPNLASLLATYSLIMAKLVRAISFKQMFTDALYCMRFCFYCISFMLWGRRQVIRYEGRTLWETYNIIQITRSFRSAWKNSLAWHSVP